MVIDNQNLVVDLFLATHAQPGPCILLFLAVGRVNEDLVAILTADFCLFFHFHVGTTTVKLLLTFKIQFEDAGYTELDER